MNANRSDSGKNVSFCVYAMDNATNFSVGIGCMRGNASASTTSFTIFVEKCKYCTQPGDTLERVIGGLLCASQVRSESSLTDNKAIRNEQQLVPALGFKWEPNAGCDQRSESDSSTCSRWSSTGLEVFYSAT